jgi:hypothetical protein
MKEALKLALEALQWSKPHKDAVITHSEAITAINAALAQGETSSPRAAQEPEYRCCPHDSDCAVHNMPAYPAGQCDCSYSNKFNLPPSAQIHEICLKLVERELDKLTNENFGRTPNDAWANKIVDVYHFFDSNPKAKKLTEIYTTPQQRPWVDLTFAEICGAEIVATNGDDYLSLVKFAKAIEAKLKEKNT